MLGSTVSYSKIHAAGAVCLAAGLLGASTSSYLTSVGRAVTTDPFSYPHGLPGFTALQMVVALTRVGLILGLLALWWCGAVPHTRRARFGHHGAVVLMAGLTVAEGVAISVPGSSLDATPSAFGVVYAVYTILLGVALLTMGLEMARGGVWRDWRRWLPSILGLWLLVPVLAALALSREAAGWAISAWLLLFALLGLALLREDGPVQHGPPAAGGGRDARTFAVLTWVYVAAFGSSSIPIAAYLVQHGTLPSFLGVFTMYGGPWSARVQTGTRVLLLLAFLVVTLGAAWAAWLVWNGSKAGAVVSLVLLPVEAAFWFGFDLPLPWLIGIARIALLAVAWRSLSGPRGRVTAAPGG